MLDCLRACFVSGRVLYTRHARDEMRSEGLVQYVSVRYLRLSKLAGS